MNRITFCIYVHEVRHIIIKVEFLIKDKKIKFWITLGTLKNVRNINFDQRICDHHLSEFVIVYDFIQRVVSFFYSRDSNAISTVIRKTRCVVIKIINGLSK